MLTSADFERSQKFTYRQREDDLHSELINIKALAFCSATNLNLVESRAKVANADSCYKRKKNNGNHISSLSSSPSQCIDIDQRFKVYKWVSLYVWYWVSPIRQNLHWYIKPFKRKRSCAPSCLYCTTTFIIWREGNPHVQPPSFGHRPDSRSRTFNTFSLECSNPDTDNIKMIGCINKGRHGSGLKLSLLKKILHSGKKVKGCDNNTSLCDDFSKENFFRDNISKKTNENSDADYCTSKLTTVDGITLGSINSDLYVVEKGVSYLS